MEIQQVTLDDYLAVVKRRKWSFLVPTIVIFLVAVSIAAVLPPVYKSTAKIIIEEQEIPDEFVMSSVTGYAEQRLQSINQKIMSHSKLVDIIDRFNLYSDNDLQGIPATEQIVNMMRNAITLEYINAEMINQRTGRPASATIAFTLSYEGEEPKTTQQVTNMLTSLFLEENLQVRKKKALGTSEFIESEMRRINADLAEDAAKIARFKEQYANLLPDLLQVNLQALHRIEINLERLNEQLHSLNEKERYLKSQLASTPPFQEQKNEKRLEELENQLAFLQTRFSDEYPDVIKAKADITELEKVIVEEAKLSVSAGEHPDNPTYISLASQLDTIAVEIDSYKRQIKGLELKAAEYNDRIEAMPKVEEEYRRLVLERNGRQAKYDDLSRKLMESTVAYGLEKEQKGEHFILLDPPLLPVKPYKPNRLAIILMGLVLGITVGIVTLCLMEYNDKAIRSAEELFGATSFPVLVSVPEIETEKDIARRRTIRSVQFAGIILFLVGGVALLHFYIIDLNIFWDKLMQRMHL